MATRAMGFRVRSRTGIMAGVALLAVIGVAGWNQWRATAIDGYVYATRDLTGTPTTPVAGAVVSSDQSDTTTTTDQAGHFHLRTRRVAGDEFLVVTVRTPGAIVRHRSVGRAVAMTIVIGGQRAPGSAPF